MAWSRFTAAQHSHTGGAYLPSPFVLREWLEWLPLVLVGEDLCRSLHQNHISSGLLTENGLWTVKSQF